MVEQVVRLTVSFSVTDAQMSAFKSIASEMTEGTGPEPGTTGYEWFVSADGMQFRLVETYVDAAAVEAHFMGSVEMCIRDRDRCPGLCLIEQKTIAIQAMPFESHRIADA